MTRVVEIPISLNIQAAAALHGAARIFLEEFRAAAVDVGLHVTTQVKGVIHESGGLWSTGTLANSIDYATEVGAQMVSVMVGTGVEYAKYQEFGTIPHFVPFHIAPSLYLDAKRSWGWVEPTDKETAHLDQTRRWLKPGPDARPTWGVMVSGRKQPFVYPGWEQSLAWIEQRVQQAANQAAARLSGGG